MSINIKFKATHPDAILPAANNKEIYTGDTGYDLVAVENITISSGSSKIVPVGLTVADITPGYWIKIEPRSGLGFKKSLQPHLGVIDNGYRGDLSVKMYNFHDSCDAIIEKGEKIAQLVVYELLQPKCEWATEISESTRGDKGFGSSDTVTRPPFAIKKEDRSWKEPDYKDMSSSACDNTSTSTNIVDSTDS
jgi:dUTP pyrophosphatase